MTLSRIASIALYLSVFAFIMLFSFLAKKTKKNFFIFLAVFVPAILVALRGEVGTDTTEYINMYDEISTIPLEKAVEKVTSFGIEPFAVFSIRILHAVNLKYFFFYLLYSIITFGFTYLFANKYSKDKTWLIYSAAAIIILPFSINVMRQAAAIAVISYLIARLFYNHNEWVKNISLFLFAVTLHFSVAMLIPLFTIYAIYRVFGFKRTAAVLSLAIALSLVVFPKFLSFALNNHLVSDKYTDTISQFDSNLMNFDFVIFIGLFTLLVLTRRHKNTYDQETNDFVTLIVLCNIFYSGIGFFSAYIGRMSDYFWPTAIVGLWLGINRFKDDARFKTAIYLAGIVLYFVLTCIILGNSQIIPYKFA